MEDLAGGSKGKKRAKAGSDETVIKAPAAATPQSRSGGRSIKFTLTEEKVVENGASRSGKEKAGMGVAPAEESDDSLEYLSDF